MNSYVVRIEKLDPFKELHPASTFADTPGKAKYKRLVELKDVYPDLEYIDLTATKDKI